MKPARTSPSRVPYLAAIGLLACSQGASASSFEFSVTGTEYISYWSCPIGDGGSGLQPPCTLPSPMIGVVTVLTSGDADGTYFAGDTFLGLSLDGAGGYSFQTTADAVDPSQMLSYGSVTILNHQVTSIDAAYQDYTGQWSYDFQGRLVYFHDGEHHVGIDGVGRLTELPEPATITMWLVGLAALSVRFRRGSASAAQQPAHW